MNRQKSFEHHDQGTLYLIPTPIGNLEDITYRALKHLRTVDVIAAEDTRHTKNLLRHFEISAPLTSYHEHNKETKAIPLLERLANGESIAVVSDAGMPAVSDPGYELVRSAISQDAPVVVLPGANAALCALTGSGLSVASFLFYGFLPRKKKDKEQELAQLKNERSTLLFYESPFRVKDTLVAIHSTLGDRPVAVARELTKRHEEYLRGTVSDVLASIDDQTLKGEFCLVVEGLKGEKQADANPLWWGHLSIADHVDVHVADGVPTKEAIKKVAHERQMVKREVYQIYHQN